MSNTQPNSIEEAAMKAVADQVKDPENHDFFTADAHGKTENQREEDEDLEPLPQRERTAEDASNITKAFPARAWAERLGVDGRPSDYGHMRDLPTASELLEEARNLDRQVPFSQALPSLSDPGFRGGSTPEASLVGSVYRLDQDTLVRFAKAQAAFIMAQNDHMKNPDTRMIAHAQHVFIEAQAAVLAKFGVC